MPDSVAKYLNKTGLETYNESLPHSATQMQEYVSDWLDEHPEATTTVPDGSISTVKLADGAVTGVKIADGTIPDAKLFQTGGVLERVNNFTTEQNVNLFNINDPDVLPLSLIDGYGTITAANYMRVSGYIPIKPNVAYEVPIYVGKIGTTARAIPIYDANKNHVQRVVGTYDEATKRLTFTATNSAAAYTRINFPERGQRALYYTPWHYYGIFMLTEAPFPDRYYTYGAKNIITNTAYLPESRENDYNSLITKTALFYGDSICYGDDYDGWAGRIGRKNRMTWENMGISGATFQKNNIAGCIVEQPVPFTNPDYIILEGGTNDADRIGNAIGEQKPTAFGTWSYTNWGTDDAATNYGFDITTFCGAFEYMLKRITTLYPSVNLGYIVAQKMGRTNDYRASANNRRYYFQTAMEICEKWGVPYLNLWDGCYLNPSNPSMYNSDAQGDPAYCYIDGQHLTAKGYDYITSIIEAWMKTL